MSHHRRIGGDRGATELGAGIERRQQAVDAERDPRSLRRGGGIVAEEPLHAFGAGVSAAQRRALKRRAAGNDDRMPWPALARQESFPEPEEGALRIHLPIERKALPALQ